MKDIRKLKELIIEKLPLSDLLLFYGVKFQFDPRTTSEAQFSCYFHGKDTKPSARLYNDTKTCFCWVCRKTWDVVSFTMEAENFSFGQAINFLINKHHLDTSSIPDEITFESYKPKISTTRIALQLLRNRIIDLRGKIQFEQYRKLCTALCMLRYQESMGTDIIPGTKKVQAVVDKLKENQNE